MMSSLEIGALVALVEQGQLSEAERRTRALLAQHPSAGMLWKILGVALLRQGKDALQSLRRTTELLPQDPEAHQNLGAALYDQGQWAAALTSLQAALALQPDNVGALVDAANAMRQLGRASEALPLYQRALKFNPQEVEAQNNLGNAFLELNQYPDAERCYRQALALKPGNAQVLCNLGFVLGALGRPEEAGASYRQALALSPDFVEALNGLGNVLRDLGNRREAASLYRRATELDPGRADSHCNLGIALFEFRRIDEAMASYRRSLAIRPDYAPAHLNLALALRQQRHPADAEASCRAALAIAPDYVEALALLGELRADRGQFAEAQALFQQAIARRAEYAAGYASIATHRRMTTDDTAWLKGAEALLAKRLPLAQNISLEYALGKYYDDVEQYDRAFAHYHQANELVKRNGATYDRVKLTARVDQIIRSFDQTFVCRISMPPAISELPVLIIGMPRSGTSLAEQILASHRSAYGAGEVVFWNAAYDSYRHAELAGQSAADLIPGMTRDYLERLTAMGGSAIRVVDKMPANFWYAGLIHAAFPQARIIHLKRHPLDTCLSIYFQNFFNMGPYANDLADLAHFYGEYLRVMDHWRAVLPASTLLEVTYEALVDDPEPWARRMVEFIGLPWDPRCLEFHQTDRVVITASKWQVRQKINRGSVGRWRNYEQYLGPLRLLSR